MINHLHAKPVKICSLKQVAQSISREPMLKFTSISFLQKKIGKLPSKYVRISFLHVRICYAVKASLSNSFHLPGQNILVILIIRKGTKENKMLCLFYHATGQGTLISVDWVTF